MMKNKLLQIAGCSVVFILFSCSENRIIHQIEIEAIADTSFATALYVRNVESYLGNKLVEVSIINYNQNWQITNSKSYDDKGVIFAEHEYKYDGWGCLNEEKYYMSNAKGNKHLMNCSTYHYLYNNPYYISEVIVTDQNNQFQTKLSYQYPNDSLVIIQGITPFSAIKKDTVFQIENCYYTLKNDKYYITKRYRNYDGLISIYKYVIDNDNMIRIEERDGDAPTKSIDIMRDKYKRVTSVITKDKYEVEKKMFSYNHNDMFPYLEKRIINGKDVDYINMKYDNGYLSEAYVTSRYSDFKPQLYTFKQYGKGFNSKPDSSSRLALIKLLGASAGEISNYLYLEDWQSRPIN